MKSIDVESSLEKRLQLYVKKVQMNSERQCGISSLLPMSCRGRAEAFARRLHTRLRRLGTDSRDTQADWPPIALRADACFDCEGAFDTPISPQEEMTEGELAALVSVGNPRTETETPFVLSAPAEQESPTSNSDSDATYYDIESEPDPSTKLPLYLKFQRPSDETHTKISLIQTPPKLNMNATTTDYIDRFVRNKSASPEQRQSPVKTIPVSRENGFIEYGGLERKDSQNSLYSPIRFDECQKRKSLERQNGNLDHESSPTPIPSSVPTFCNGKGSPEHNVSHDEPDFARPSVLEDNKINSGIENKSFSNGTNSNESIVKEINVETLNEKDFPDLPLNDEAPLEESNLHILREEAREISRSLEKLNLIDSQDDQTTKEENSKADNEDENEDLPQRVRRCSSLKSGKTPPGTPGRKKIVRFADVLGLDLADVKTFMDDIPNIPKSAYQDLRDADLSMSSTESLPPSDAVAKLSDKCLVCMFSQPGDRSNFLDILNGRSVCLENAYVQEGATIAICGTVRVRNLDFHKSVQIRYSLDSWKTFSDLQASYVPNSCDGFSDRFQFLLYAHTIMVGQKLEFAVRFMCKGCQFWDNNLGANYCYRCVPFGSTENYFRASCPSQANEWQASFY